MKTPILLLSLFTIFTTFSQKEIKEKIHIKENGRNIIFEIDDKSQQKEPHYDINKTYYWFKAQKIVATEGGASGNLLDGQYISYYKNSQIDENGTFKKGLKNNTWKHWNENGKIVFIENWKSGQLKSKIIYDSIGSIIKKEKKSFSRLKVTSKDSINIYSKNKQTTILFNAKGQKTQKKRFKNQMLHGSQIIWDENRKKHKNHYKKGELVTKKKQEKNKPLKELFKRKAKKDTDKPKNIETDNKQDEKRKSLKKLFKKRSND